MDQTMSSICPYLGSWRDSLTAYMYPTGANCCNADKNPAEIDKSDQQQSCLTPDHAACSRYAARVGATHRPN